MCKDINKYTVLISTTIGSFLTPFMGSAINIALPAIGKEFNMNAIILGWVQTTYLLSAAICLVPIGRIADIVGRRRVFFYGLIIFGIFSFLNTCAVNAKLFLLFRVVQGIGGAMIFGTAVAILTDAFPLEERGRVLGINVAGVYLGLSAGPFLGGYLVQNFGWRSIFIFITILSILVMILILLFLKYEKQKFNLRNFDYIGASIYGIALFFLMYGFSSLPRALGMIFIVIGIFCFLIFIKLELKNSSPLFNINLFKINPAFLFSNLAAMINYSSTNAVSFLLSLYLQYLKGLTPQMAGMIMIFQPVTMTILSPIAGRMSDRIQPGILASIGMGLNALSLFFLAFINPATSLNMIIIYLLILGIGFALFSSPNTNAVMSSVEKKYYGIASGTLATMRLLGQMSSMGIVMLIFSLFIGRVNITQKTSPLFLSSMKFAFIIFTILCVIGVFASLRRGRIERI
jgi:EmrB/QacA subfamily drug resistance transporter